MSDDGQTGDDSETGFEFPADDYSNDDQNAGAYKVVNELYSTVDSLLGSALAELPDPRDVDSSYSPADEIAEILEDKGYSESTETRDSRVKAILRDGDNPDIEIEVHVLEFGAEYWADIKEVSSGRIDVDESKIVTPP